MTATIIIGLIGAIIGILWFVTGRSFPDLWRILTKKKPKPVLPKEEKEEIKKEEFEEEETETIEESGSSFDEDFGEETEEF